LLLVYLLITLNLYLWLLIDLSPQLIRPICPHFSQTPRYEVALSCKVVFKLCSNHSITFYKILYFILGTNREVKCDIASQNSNIVQYLQFASSRSERVNWHISTPVFTSIANFRQRRPVQIFPFINISVTTQFSPFYHTEFSFWILVN